MGLLGMLGLGGKSKGFGSGFGSGIVAGDEPDYMKRMREAWGIGSPDAAQDMPQQPERKFLGMTGADMADWGNTFAQAGAMFDGDWGTAAQISNNRMIANAKADPNAKFREWQKQYDYERANPKPVNNDTAADYQFWKERLSPEDFQKWVNNRVDPPQYRQGPDGAFYRVNTAETPQQQNLPTAPVGRLTPIAGGATPNIPAPPAQSISQAEFMRLQRAMGPQQALNYIRARNIAIGN